MFSSKQPAPGASGKTVKGAAPGLSFFGPEVIVSGDVVTTAQIHLDGRIDGNVRCAQLCQGEGGAIAGDILADEARIAGRVDGTVNAGILIVEATAKIAGDVTYETLTIAAGAAIEGRLARRQALAAGQPEPAVLIVTGEQKAAAPGLLPLDQKRTGA